VVSFTIRPLSRRGKNSRYPLETGLGLAQTRFGRGGEEKNSQPLPGIEPPKHSNNHRSVQIQDLGEIKINAFSN